MQLLFLYALVFITFNAFSSDILHVIPTKAYSLVVRIQKTYLYKKIKYSLMKKLNPSKDNIIRFF